MDTPATWFPCVIFDMDGTLTRTNTLIFETFNHVARKYLNREFSPAEIIALFGPPEEGAVDKIFGVHRRDEVMDEMCRFYRDEHPRLASLHDGVGDILDFLKQEQVRIAVFTGKGRRTASISMEILGIRRYIELLVSGNDVDRHKPDPEGIDKVLAEFRLAPDQALMVGDSTSDIKASRGAGVKVASVLWDSYEPEKVLAAAPDFVFRTPGAMLSWFRQLRTERMNACSR